MSIKNKQEIYHGVTESTEKMSGITGYSMLFKPIVFLCVLRASVVIIYLEFLG